MKTITVELTDTQYKALGCVALNPEEYIQNYASVRSDKAIKDISQKIIEEKIDSGESIPSSREEIIMSDEVVMLKDLPAEDESENTE